MRDSNEVFPRHPLTCAQPVMPAFTLCRSIYLGIDFRKYSINTGLSGRGPTKLISPLSTLINWGNSSRLVARNIRPNDVTRGSLVVAQTGPVTCSAFLTIV